MITTRDIDVNSSEGRTPLKQKTTKEIDIHVKTGIPKLTKIAVTTHDIEDVADMAEKKRRDSIMAQKKNFRKGDTVYKDEKGKLKTEGQLKEKEEELIIEKRMVKEKK